MWVNCDERLLQCKVVPGISDHKMITASFHMGVDPKRVASFTCRSWRGVDVDSYVRDLQRVDWSFLDGDNIEDIWTNWKTTITKTMDNHSKIIQIKQNKNQCKKPWVSADILSVIRRKQAAEIRKDYFPTQENENIFRAAKIEMNKKLFQAKQRFYQDKISENTGNPRKIWAIIKDIAPATMNSKTHKEINIAADTFAEFFSGISNVEPLKELNLNISHTSERPTRFDLQYCSEACIANIIDKMPLNKANGIDEVPMKAIKLGKEALLGPITKLVNRFIDLGFPTELKTSIVLPIHKKGPADLPNNYRPISLLPCVSKIAEKAVSDQLNAFLKSEDILSSAQHGNTIQQIQDSYI